MPLRTLNSKKTPPVKLHSHPEENEAAVSIEKNNSIQVLNLGKLPELDSS